MKKIIVIVLSSVLAMPAGLLAQQTPNAPQQPTQIAQAANAPIQVAQAEGAAAAAGAAAGAVTTQLIIMGIVLASVLAVAASGNDNVTATATK